MIVTVVLFLFLFIFIFIFIEEACLNIDDLMSSSGGFGAVKVAGMGNSRVTVVGCDVKFLHVSLNFLIYDVKFSMFCYLYISLQYSATIYELW